MKKHESKKMVLRPVEEIPALAARVKVSEDHAETTKRIARLAKQRLKIARRTHKHARKVAKRARKAAAKLRQELAAAMKKLSRIQARAVKAKSAPKASAAPANAGKAAMAFKGKTPRVQCSTRPLSKKNLRIRRVTHRAAPAKVTSPASGKSAANDLSAATASTELTSG